MKPAPALQLWPCRYEECFNDHYVIVRLKLPNQGRPYWRNDELIKRTGHETLDDMRQMFPAMRERLWVRYAHYVRFRQACAEFPVEIWHVLFDLYGPKRHVPIETLEDFMTLSERDLSQWHNVGRVKRRIMRQAQERLAGETVSSCPVWDEWATTLPGWTR